MTCDELLETFATLYTPHSRDPMRFLALYRDALRGWSPEVIAIAWPKIRDTHDRTDRWPTIAACKRALEEAAKTTPKPAPAPKAPTDWRPPTDEERARVAALMTELRAAMAGKSLANRETGKPAPKVDRDNFRGVPDAARWWDR